MTLNTKLQKKVVWNDNLQKNIQNGNLQNLQNVFLKYTILQNENLQNCYPKRQFAKKIKKKNA